MVKSLYKDTAENYQYNIPGVHKCIFLCMNISGNSESPIMLRKNMSLVLIMNACLAAELLQQ